MEKPRKTCVWAESRKRGIAIHRNRKHPKKCEYVHEYVLPYDRPLLDASKHDEGLDGSTSHRYGYVCVAARAWQVWRIPSARMTRWGSQVRALYRPFNSQETVLSARK